MGIVLRAGNIGRVWTHPSQRRKRRRSEIKSTRMRIGGLLHTTNRDTAIGMAATKKRHTRSGEDGRRGRRKRLRHMGHTLRTSIGHERRVAIARSNIGIREVIIGAARKASMWRRTVGGLR